jgi:hypothetical protein
MCLTSVPEATFSIFLYLLRIQNHNYNGLKRVRSILNGIISNKMHMTKTNNNKWSKVI